MPIRLLSLCAIGILLQVEADGQHTDVTDLYSYDSVRWEYRGNCKVLQPAWFLLPLPPTPVSTARYIVNATSPKEITRKSAISIHGNLTYNFLYRSLVDTPFAQSDFRQHTIQTALAITVKDKYPLRVNISQRISNSPWFRNFFDINARFDSYAYMAQVRRNLINRLSAYRLNRPDLSKLDSTLQALTNKYKALKRSMDNKSALQRIVEEREKSYYKGRPTPSLSTVPPFDPSILDKQTMFKKVQQRPVIPERAGIPSDSSFTVSITQRQRELDSLEQKMLKMQSRIDSIKNTARLNVDVTSRHISQATSWKELSQIEKELGIPAERPRGFEKFIRNLKSIGIGRSVVNYSELTAWDVSLTGFNMEYNPGIYTAVAVGKIDYGFRDFLGGNSRQKGQNFLMGRIGVGDKDRKAIILSAFTGRKLQYGSILSDSVTNYSNIVGYSLQLILKKDENTNLSAEIAKTTRPITGNTSPTSDMKSLWQFKDNANLGISIKGQTMLARTNTRLSGHFRKTGESFQSFSLFTYNTDQTAWSLAFEQPFLNNRVSVTGMLRQNDFTNPFTEKTFKTSTVFKSIQVNVRVPKWPAFSAGYFPGTQLYIIDKKRIQENAYYIVNGSLIYHYDAGNTRMLSSLIYSRFAGKGTDSGFIAYSGASYLASHTVMINKAQLQGSYMFTDQDQMQFWSLDGNIDYSIREWIRAGAGLRLNKVIEGKTYTGGRGNIGLTIKKLGVLNFQYEKSYLPTIWHTLYPVETGSVTWYKYF